MHPRESGHFCLSLPLYQKHTIGFFLLIKPAHIQISEPGVKIIVWLAKDSFLESSFLSLVNVAGLLKNSFLPLVRIAASLEDYFISFVSAARLLDNFFGSLVKPARPLDKYFESLVKAARPLDDYFGSLENIPAGFFGMEECEQANASF